MEPKKFFLGIDLGTSSVKGILRDKSGCTFRAKGGYSGEEPQAWLEAVQALIAELKETCGGEIAALAISSQVGTYVVNDREVISWRSAIGGEELAQIKAEISPEEFVRAIGMAHPDLISYPLPRLRYIQNTYGPSAQVLMPKELLLRELTGRVVTDVFSMRGLAHPETGRYADGLLARLGIKIALPELKRPTDLAGFVTPAAAERFGLAPGTPVYLGCNDFFAGLLGMGIVRCGDFFDLSGTSEHVGYVSPDLNPKGFVSGGYFVGNCTYGGTKSSGASCDLAIHNFGIGEIDLDRVLKKQPPIFLPYLNGERAPIFDEKARGVYFGLNDRTDREDLAYATLEGVVFSLYDIACGMNAPQPQRLICGGGSARDPLMNTLRATLFGCETVSVCEKDTSALGACLLAMVGEGVYPDLPTAIEACVDYRPGVPPRPEYRPLLQKRFEIYKEVYRNLVGTFEKFSHLPVN